MAVTSAVGRISAAHPPPGHLWFKIRLRDTHWLPVSPRRLIPFATHSARETRLERNGFVHA